MENNKIVLNQNITRIIHNVKSSRSLPYLTKIYTKTPSSRQKIIFSER